MHLDCGKLTRVDQDPKKASRTVFSVGPSRVWDDRRERQCSTLCLLWKGYGMGIRRRSVVGWKYQACWNIFSEEHAIHSPHCYMVIEGKPASETTILDYIRMSLWRSAFEKVSLTCQLRSDCWIPRRKIIVSILTICKNPWIMPEFGVMNCLLMLSAIFEINSTAFLQHDRLAVYLSGFNLCHFVCLNKTFVLIELIVIQTTTWIVVGPVPLSKGNQVPNLFVLKNKFSCSFGSCEEDSFCLSWCPFA